MAEQISIYTKESNELHSVSSVDSSRRSSEAVSNKNDEINDTEWKDYKGTTRSRKNRKTYKTNYRWSYHNKTVRPLLQERTCILWCISFADKDNSSNMQELRAILFDILTLWDAFDALDVERARINPRYSLKVDSKREVAFVGIPVVLCAGESEGEALARLWHDLLQCTFHERHEGRMPGMKKEITDDLAGCSVYNICSSTGLLKDSFVMHNDDIDVVLSNARSTLEYYGPDAAQYSVFMHHYASSLVYPAVFGLVMWGLRLIGAGDIVALEVLFGFFLTVWATLFVEGWKRRITQQTDAFHLESYEVSIDSVERKHLKSVVAYIRSDDTGPMPEYEEMCFKTSKSMSEYLHPTLALFVGASIVGVTIYLLNALQDIVDQDERWPGMWKQAPFVLYIVVMIVLEHVYNQIAEVLTDWEAHRIPKEATKSLAMKKTLFAYLNMFGYPLYVAFYQQNLTVLRDYVFVTVSLKQILLGTVVEMAPLLFRSKKRSDQHNSAEEWIHAMREEYDTAPADIFMEYSEMFLDFGFLVLFSQFCEWIALWSLIHTTLETMTDQKKFRLQRRFYGSGFLDARDLASCFEAASLLGVVTSASYFLILCAPRWTLWIVAVEHCVILFKLYLSMMIPDEPEDVFLRRVMKRRKVD